MDQIWTSFITSNVFHYGLALLCVNVVVYKSAYKHVGKEFELAENISSNMFALCPLVSVARPLVPFQRQHGDIVWQGHGGKVQGVHALLRAKGHQIAGPFDAKELRSGAMAFTLALSVPEKKIIFRRVFRVETIDFLKCQLFRCKFESLCSIIIIMCGSSCSCMPSVGIGHVTHTLSLSLCNCCIAMRGVVDFCRSMSYWRCLVVYWSCMLCLRTDLRKKIEINMLKLFVIISESMPHRWIFWIIACTVPCCLVGRGLVCTLLLGM